MSSTEFKYKVQQDQKFPFVPITLSRLGKSVPAEALIDSGSPYSLITKEVGDILGLKTRGAPTKICGIGGQETLVYPTDIDTELSGRKFAFKFYLPFKKSGTPLTILGRDSIFEEFEVKFRQRELKFALSDY